VEAAEEFVTVTGNERPDSSAVRSSPAAYAVADSILEFILDRLRIQLRAEGFPADIVTAAIGTDDDILRIIARAEALRALIETEDGKSLLAAYKRAQNILRIEDKKDGPHTSPIDASLLTHPAEIALESALTAIEPQVAQHLAAENFTAATTTLATLRPPLDAFFTDVMVNDPEENIRKNRLRLLSRLKSAMDSVADLSKIEA
jgi:glycyl-tRNA synthetase beta chain